MTEAERLLKEALPTLLIGTAGALLFWAVGFPAAALTGPAAAVSLATLAGLRSHVPARLRDAAFLVIGVSIGSTVTPEVIATARAWPLSFFLLGATLVGVLFAVRALLIGGFGFDRTTAVLAATPGHLSFIVALSADLRVDVSRIALVQSVRVLLLTLVVPILITLWGAQGTALADEPVVISPGPAAVVFAVALAFGLLLMRIRVPAALLLGAMAVSAVGHGADLARGVLPHWSTVIAFVVMGSLIGTRFRGLGRAGLLGSFAAGAAATFVTCAVAAVGAALAAEVLGLPPAVLLLAFAPGGVEVMAALAVETSLEPAFVAAHHVFRLILLGVLLPVLLARIRSP